MHPVFVFFIGMIVGAWSALIFRRGKSAPEVEHCHMPNGSRQRVRIVPVDAENRPMPTKAEIRAIAEKNAAHGEALIIGEYRETDWIRHGKLYSPFTYWEWMGLSEADYVLAITLSEIAATPKDQLILNGNYHEKPDHCRDAVAHILRCDRKRLPLRAGGRVR